MIVDLLTIILVDITAGRHRCAHDFDRVGMGGKLTAREEQIRVKEIQNFLADEVFHLPLFDLVDQLEDPADIFL